MFPFQPHIGVQWRDFYRAALMLPLVFPIFAAPGIHYFFRFHPLATLFFYSFVFAGPPYALFAWLGFSWLGRTPNRIWVPWLVWLAPLAFSPILGFWTLALAWLGEGVDFLPSMARNLPRLAAYELALGYFYCSIVEALFWALRAMRFIPSQAAHRGAVSKTDGLNNSQSFSS